MSPKARDCTPSDDSKKLLQCPRKGCRLVPVVARTSAAPFSEIVEIVIEFTRRLRQVGQSLPHCCDGRQLRQRSSKIGLAVPTGVVRILVTLVSRRITPARLRINKKYYWGQKYTQKGFIPLSPLQRQLPI